MCGEQVLSYPFLDSIKTGPVRGECNSGAHPHQMQLLNHAGGGGGGLHKAADQKKMEGAKSKDLLEPEENSLHGFSHFH